MNKYCFNGSIKNIFFISFFFACAVNFSFGQGIDAAKLLDKIILNPEYRQESVIIKQMRLQKIEDKKILDYMDETYGKPRRAAAMKKLASGDPLPRNFTQQDLLLASSCNNYDIGVDLGLFATWQGQTSCWNNTGSTAPCLNSPWVTATLPVAGRIIIVPAPTSDPCGSAVGFPIPLPSPTGGNYSIRLGNNLRNSESERITHQFIVQASDTNFTYQYAAVFEDPGHLPSAEPYFEFVILAQNGDTIPCSFNRIVSAGGSATGFHASTNAVGCGGLTTVYYKPWTTAGINLVNYIGQQVTIVCTTADCSQCGHFGYAYVDFSCGVMEPKYCTGQQLTLCSPDSTIGNTYQWYHNGTPYPGGTVACISTALAPGDTFSLHVSQPSGCNFDMQYVPQDTCLVEVGEVLNPNYVSIFPNPASGNLFIDFGSKNSGKAEITFTDIIGKTLIAENKTAAGQHVFDVSALSKGIYFVRINTGERSVTRKIVISR